MSRTGKAQNDTCREKGIKAMLREQERARQREREKQEVKRKKAIKNYSQMQTRRLPPCLILRNNTFVLSHAWLKKGHISKYSYRSTQRFREYLEQELSGKSAG